MLPGHAAGSRSACYLPTPPGLFQLPLDSQFPAPAHFLIRKRIPAASHAPTVPRLGLSNECDTSINAAPLPANTEQHSSWSCNRASAHSTGKLTHQNKHVKQEQRRWDRPSTSLQLHSLLTAPAKGDWSFTQPRLGHPKDRTPPPRWGPAPGLHRPPGERAYPNAQPDPAAQLVASLLLAPGTPEKHTALCSS